MFSVICFLTTLHLIGPMNGSDPTATDTVQTPPLAVRAVEQIPVPDEIVRPGRITPSLRRYDGSRPGVTRKSPVAAGLFSTGATVLPFGGGLAMVLTDDSATDEGATATGLALMAGGVVVGPAIGHLYAENGDRAVNGMLARGMMILVTVYVSAVNPALGGIIAFPLMIGTLGSLFSDLASAADAARVSNARHGLDAREGMAIAPRVDPINRQVGLALRLTF